MRPLPSDRTVPYADRQLQPGEVVTTSATLAIGRAKVLKRDAVRLLNGRPRGLATTFRTRG